MLTHAHVCVCDRKQVPSTKSFRLAAAEVDKDFSYKFSNSPNDEDGKATLEAKANRSKWAKENGRKMRTMIQVLQKEAQRSKGGSNLQFRNLKARAIA